MKVEISDAVFQSYALYTAILVIKMGIMALLTAVQRVRKRVFPNPEDKRIFNTISGLVERYTPVAADPDKPATVVTYDDPDVERTRRAHLNDMECIPLFFAIGLIYCFTNPDLFEANLLFRIFTGARIIHTFVYAICVLPQPSRGLSWGIGQLCTLYMTVKVIIHFV